MKTKTILTSILLLAASSLASFACDCDEAKKPVEEPKQESLCNCAPACMCADNAEAPKADIDETTEEN